MVHDGDFIIPGFQFGNVFVGIQPSRPPLTEEDIASAAHDKTRPPHHQYVAFYRWLQTEIRLTWFFM
jgi:cobaltochelatase CobN